MADTEEWAHRACLRMAEVTVMHSVMTNATGSMARVSGRRVAGELSSSDMMECRRSFYIMSSYDTATILGTIDLSTDRGRGICLIRSSFQAPMKCQRTRGVEVKHAITTNL